jgi:serine/threonine protein kinase/beta-lactam-binding protein with PASTA domain
LIGQELGGRYEIINRIGSGGMAIVYKAHDILLHRKVAIKVLRQQFVNDEDFIRRFRREAQSAASLSHPNVVSIYDVGQEDEIHYIVMEYIEGNNLNDQIKERAPFQVEEAVHVATQICDALDHAHHNQIIHRDIKPHNILIGKNGRVKVTDFGIARAAASSDITQTGSVIGSVHYFSPEHAKGVAQGEKSDIYSLGIVLYQMLTNKLPFVGESPISVALKHLQEPVEEPRKVNLLIPQSVENIILKALRKSPSERYASAKDMLDDLEQCLLPANRNENKAVFASEGEEIDHDQTLVMPALRSERAFQELYEDEEENRVKNKWIKPIIWIFITALLIFFMWIGVKSLYAMVQPPPDVVVPNVIGLPIDEAIAELEKANLTVALPFDTEYDDMVPKDIVMDQDKKNIRVKERSPIQLVVSLGVKMEVMPDFSGQQWADVERKLKDLGLTEEQIKQNTVINEKPAGTVLEQSPKPDVEFNSKNVEVTITVSEGLGTFDMPNLIGKTESAALTILEKNDLNPNPDGPRYDTSFTVPEGYVFKQFPMEPGDPVARGAEITIWVSSGYPKDALQPTVNMKVSPEEEGEPSTIRIIIRDARGDRERDPIETTTTMTLPVQVVVSPDIDAIITILRNDKFVDSHTVTYKDAQEQNAQQPEAIEASQADITDNESEPSNDDTSTGGAE